MIDKLWSVLFWDHLRFELEQIWLKAIIVHTILIVWKTVSKNQYVYVKNAVNNQLGAVCLGIIILS